MRIAFIAASFPPDLGWDAPANRAYELVSGLRQQGEEVEVFALASDVSTKTMQDGSVVHRINVNQDLIDLKMVPQTTPGPLTIMSSRNALWKAFLEEHARSPFDLVDATSTMWDGLLPTLCGLLPVVLRHQPDLSSYDKSCVSGESAFSIDRELVDGLATIAMSMAESVYCADERTAVELTQKRGAAVDVIPHVVDLSRFTTDGALAFAAEVERKVIILASVKDETVKKYICDLMIAVAEQSPTVQFIVLAEDVSSDDDEWHVQDSMKTLLKEPGQITVTRAYHELLPELLRSAPIVFVAPNSRNLPDNWLQVMACGRALICSADPGSEAFKGDDAKAIVVEKFDVVGAATAICSLRDDASLRVKLASGGAEFVQANHSGSEAAKTLVSLYKRSVQKFASVEGKAARARSLSALIDRSEVLLKSYDKMLYDMLFNESPEFRIKHWLGKIKSRGGRSTIGQKILSVLGPKRSEP